MRSKHYLRGRKLERDTERAARRIGEQLPGEHRRILAWARDGRSTAEIARDLGTKMAYVDSVLDGLTQQLRAAIGFYESKRFRGRVYTFTNRRDTIDFAEERGWLPAPRPREEIAER